MRNSVRNGWPILLVILLLMAPFAFAQDEGEEEGPGFSLGFDVNLGVRSFEVGRDAEGNPIVETYQSVGLMPDIGFGKFGLGLDLGINYRFTGGEDGDEFEVRREDWDPGASDLTFLELYLPKFRYVRYGQKGEPLFARFGSFSDARLGNGFIMSGYSNEMFLPEQRIFGGNLDIDGRLFNFPYVGIETVVGNVAQFDVMASRLFVRPFAWMDAPLLPALQVGATVATDRDPFLHANRDEDFPIEDPPDESVTMYGFDTLLPIFSNNIASMATYADLAFQNGKTGGMVGAGGRLIGIFVYSAQIRAFQDNFIPNYFDYSYDRRRALRYYYFQNDLAAYNDEVPDAAELDARAGHVGWLTTLGLAVLQDLLSFNVTLSGPFTSVEGVTPELIAQAAIQEGVIPGLPSFSAEAFYYKFEINEFNDLWEASDATIGARINYSSGPATISLVYDVRYDPFADGDPWVVTSSLETTIGLQ